MRFKSGLGLLFAVLMLTVNGHAQEPASAAEKVEQLRAQLLEVQAKEEDLRTRLQQLEESLKPENIERSLAGVGSTKPEELRESRRRQLSIQRDGLVAQLKILETSRQRLETAIANAEAAAYQQSARPVPTAANQMLSASTGFGNRWLMFGGGGVAALALAGGVLIYRRKIRLR
jgi:LPXTG-motif cell wall-anchored protein